MTKWYPVFSLLGARHNFHVTMYLFNKAEVNVEKMDKEIVTLLALLTMCLSDPLF